MAQAGALVGAPVGLVGNLFLTVVSLSLAGGPIRRFPVLPPPLRSYDLGQVAQSLHIASGSHSIRMRMVIVIVPALSG